MKQKIVCEECEEIIGEIEKEQVTDEDRRIYREGSECSQGHVGSTTILPSI